MTLTEAAALTKKALLGFAIFMVVVFFAWGGWAYYMAFVYKPPPLPEPKADPQFGLIPKLTFGKSSTSSSGFTYTLDTETGELPKHLPKILNVYSIAPLATDFLALDRAKKLAASLGFESNPTMLSTTQYRFTNSAGGILSVILDSGNFKYKDNISTESASLIENFSFEDEKFITEDLKKFLANKQVLKDQLENGSSKVVYEKPSKRESNFATIYLWQSPIKESEEVQYPIVTPKFKEGLIKGVTNRNINERQPYISLDYTYWPIDLNNAYTYPIIPVEKAYEKLKDGEGFVAVSESGKTASINKVYLAYLLTEEYQPYLQPVYVFEGEKYVGMVAAVSEEQVEKE